MSDIEGTIIFWIDSPIKKCRSNNYRIFTRGASLTRLTLSLGRVEVKSESLTWLNLELREEENERGVLDTAHLELGEGGVGE